MNSSDLGSDDWWAVVLSMPAIEAVEHLKGLRVAILGKYSNNPQSNAVSHHVIRANEEIKRLNILISNATWREAARNVLTPELYDAVCVERRRLEGDF